MNRRSVLRGIGTVAGITGLTGCVDLLTDSPREGIASIEFEPSADPVRGREEARTIVRFDEEAKTVEVEGYLYFGGGCERLGLMDVTFERAVSRLSVTVGSVEEEPEFDPFTSDSCTTAMGARWYRVTVTFSDRLAETVHVVEKGLADESGTRTVNRTAQRELCTSDHPEGSAKAKTAHWTCPNEYIAANESHSAE